MAKRAPKLVALDQDDYSAAYVGRTADGRQFFLTTPFVPGKREFVALYVFDEGGGLLEARIVDMGTRDQMDEGRKIATRDSFLVSLGEYSYGRIKVASFRVERFGVEFGFIARPPEEPDEDWCVTVEPGDYMCFWRPWTSGDYDT